MNPVFRKFDYSKELPAQRQLFEECFPENKGTATVTANYYKWKFQGYPSDKHSYEYCCNEEDDLIGYYAAIPYDYSINGKNVKVAMVCDVMTGIKARGKGIFTKLGIYSTNQFKDEGLAFSTGYPIRPEVIPGHKKAGWSFPFEIPMYGKFLKMNSFLRNKHKGFLIPFANLTLLIYSGLLELMNFSVKKKPAIEIYSAHDIDNIDGLGYFFTECQKESFISLIKTLEFLKWRLGAPTKEYTILILRKDKLIIGYSIIRKIIKENVPCIGVLDFCVLNQYKKWASLLFYHIEKSAKKENAELILMMMMKDIAKKYRLFINGFLKTPHPFSFIIKQFDSSHDSSLLLNKSNWNLMWIDSDDL